MIEDDGYVRITLRIPRDLHERLMAAAKATSKSMNAEIIGRLEASFNDTSERLQALERIVFSDDLEGNDRLSQRINSLEERLDDLLHGLARHLR